MSIENIRAFIKQKAIEYGAKVDNEFNKPYIERNNTGKDALNDNGAYFGFIHPDEETSGPFHDFSLTIFPTDQNKPWLICLGIGSNGFKNDYELASTPGLRRLFSKIVNDQGFCKSDFSDIETGLPKSIIGNKSIEHIKNTIKTYTKVLPVCQIVDSPESQEGLQIIAAFVAGYAKLRDWPTNNDQRKAVSEALIPFHQKDEENEIENICDLLKERRFVILQGPPGTGKTRAAKEVIKVINAKEFFIQFHAETDYSDFIYGIRPNVNEKELSYVERCGSFSNALKFAISNPKQNVVLIIDEINRANLANVLGPVFYLFEHKMEDSKVELEIFPGFSITKLPENLYVIATMNTADRSLAVVDFALRRRFAWYNFKPKAIKAKDFYLKDFTIIQEIFDWYATSAELSLQPGQGYFIASSESEFKNRIKYELLPLIKEYLIEGFLKNSKEEFNNYFSNSIGQSIFE